MEDRDHIDGRLRAKARVPVGTPFPTRKRQKTLRLHTVRRLRPLGRGRLYAFGSAVAVACALSACGAQAGGSTTPKASSPKGTHSSTGTQTSTTHPSSSTLQNSVSQVVIGSLITTNGAQLANDQAAVQDFFRSVASKATDSCLAADGLPAVEQQPSSGPVGDTQLPNLTYLRTQHNFATQSTTPAVDPTRGMSPAEKRSYAAAVKRCAPKIPTPAFESPAAQSIFNAWTNIMLRTISTSPAVRAANRAGASCSRSTPFPAATYEDEWQLAAGDGLALYMKGKTSAGNQVEARGSGVLVRCFGRAVNTVDRLLAAQAKPFMARYATTLRQLADKTAKQVAELSAKYDIAFGSTPRRSR